MPRAILLTALLGGGIFVLVAWTTQLARPGSAVDDPSSAAFEIEKTSGGDLISSVFPAGPVVARGRAVRFRHRRAGEHLTHALRDGPRRSPCRGLYQQ